MKQLISAITESGFGIQGTPVTLKEIQIANQELKACDLPELPKEVASFLLQCNGILRDGRCIWGIDNTRRFMYDIIGENLNSDSPDSDEILLLGETDSTFIAWHQPQKNYTIIDKSSFMVLHKFNNFVEAVKYILKIND